jgi:hypothetical protein
LFEEDIVPYAGPLNPPVLGDLGGECRDVGTFANSPQKCVGQSLLCCILW